MAITLDFLTGKTTDQLTPFQDGTFVVHKEMLSDITAMFAAAKADGFDLALSSSFRSFDDQVRIWNAKARGQRPVLDSNSVPVDIATKTPEEIMFLIMRWSAIPGGSRHHWGSDIDVYDRKAKPTDYKVQLIPSEYEAGGYFYEANLWLNEHMEDYGFFRPYAIDRGGIAPEPWHLSYRPLSEKFLQSFTFEAFSDHLSKANFDLVAEARRNEAELYQRFIQIE
jgi:LAS superfamily LD-carboxypeptidase LdcB